MDYHRIGQAVSNSCCKRLLNCLTVAKATSDVSKMHEIYHKKRKFEKLTYVQDLVVNNMEFVEEVKTFVPRINGVAVCRNAWREYYGTSHNTLQQAVSNVRDNIPSVSNPTARTFAPRNKTMKFAVIAWLRVYSEHQGGYMPLGEGDTDHIRVPERDKASVYKAYREVMLKRGQRPVSQSWFCRVWNNYTDHIKLEKDIGTFKECRTCHSLRYEARHAKNSPSTGESNAKTNTTQRAAKG